MAQARPYESQAAYSGISCLPPGNPFPLRYRKIRSAQALFDPESRFVNIPEDFIYLRVISALLKHVSARHAKRKIGSDDYRGHSVNP